MGRRCTWIDVLGCWEEAGGVWGHLIELKHKFAIDWWGHRVFRYINKLKNMISHLLLVGSRPFFCCNLVLYILERRLCEFGGLVMTTDGVWGRHFSRWCFSFVNGVVDIGDGCDGEGMILMPQTSPTVALGVGRMMQKFGVD
jgi:hypothetical protein